MTPFKCSKRIFTGERGDIGGHMCSRHAKVFINQKGFCNLHSPEGEVTRERKFQERMNRNRQEDQEREQLEKIDEADFNSQFGDR